MPTAAPGALVGGDETVLLVEDEAPVRRVTQLALQARGYRVLAVGSGAEALELVARHGAELRLLITDVVMPAMGGRQLCEAVRARGCELPILLVSGYSDEPAVPRDADRIAFLPKPYSVAALLAKVRELLDAAQVER